MSMLIFLGKIYRCLFIVISVFAVTGLIGTSSQAMQGMPPQKSQPPPQHRPGPSINWGSALGPLLIPRVPQAYPPMFIPGNIGEPPSGGPIYDDPSTPTESSSVSVPPREVPPPIPPQYEPTPTAKPSTPNILDLTGGNPPEPMDSKPPEQPPVTQGNGSNTDTETLLAQSPGNTQLPTDPASDAASPRVAIRPPTQPTPTIPPGKYHQGDPSDPNAKTVEVSEPDPTTGNVTVTIMSNSGGGSKPPRTIPATKLQALQEHLKAQGYSPPPPPDPTTPQQRADTALKSLPAGYNKVLGASAGGNYDSREKLQQTLNKAQASEAAVRNALSQQGRTLPPVVYTPEAIKKVVDAYKPPERNTGEKKLEGQNVQRTTNKVQGDDFTGGKYDPENKAGTPDSHGNVYVEPIK